MPTPTKATFARWNAPIDSKLDPQLVARFRADLGALWSDLEDREGARLGLAVSGGPDSLALLLLLHAVLPGRIAAATVDHQLRPEAASEAQFVSRRCDDLGVPHVTLPITLDEGNLQARAREARYGALARHFAGLGINALATAHHADDQAETLLMRLNRGSGLSGLAGVRPATRMVFGGQQMRILRPLLGWRKQDLEAVCADAGVTPMRDPTNDDPQFERVRLRQLLEQSDAIDSQAIAQSAGHLAQAEAFVRHAIDEVWQARVEFLGDAVRYRPRADVFENIEVLRRIFTEFSVSPPRSEIAQMAERLNAGENASLAGLLAKPEATGWWRFEPEPERRT